MTYKLFKVRVNDVHFTRYKMGSWKIKSKGRSISISPGAWIFLSERLQSLMRIALEEFRLNHYDPMDMKTVKARKNHVCLLCNRVIDKGTEYIKEGVGPWNSNDADPYTFKSHIKCYHIMRRIEDIEEMIPDAHTFLYEECTEEEREYILTHFREREDVDL